MVRCPSMVYSDSMSYFELMDIMKKIGYPNNPVVYYKLLNSDMNTGLVALNSDTEIVNMFNVHAGRTVIEIFVHTTDFVNEIEDDGIFMNERVSVVWKNHDEEEVDKEGGNIGLGDKELGDNVVVGKEREVGGSYIGDKEESDSDSSDDQHCQIKSLNDDDNQTKFSEFREKDMQNPQLQLGMIFPDIKVFRTFLREYRIKEGHIFKFVKNESSRVTVKLSDAPELKVCSMKKIIKRDLILNVSQNQVYRAKRKALEIIQGNHREQYCRLWDYCEMARRQNPGSIALLKLERPWLAASPIFQRLFICYDAQGSWAQFQDLQWTFSLWRGKTENST
ncbi:uncharacterized protein LOC130763949 [Actinidia eriantha]|uniref:uncharacterized protein LOC130763949 n=1 Tax=Actinidia eriantha TaxID=165200 RepID=UPI00258FA402|nr:uncharacterized protein LOC130763949 [Actinidia eriantha]